MSNPFVRKLECFAPLSAEHRRAIEDLTAHVTTVAPRKNLVKEGDEPTSVNVVMSGWACRYKILPDGRRQILSLFLPGDMCDPYVFLLGELDYAIAALTPCTVAKLPSHSIRALAGKGPQITDALWWQTLVTLDTQREWSTSLGRRTALECIAHLFCEVTARLTAIGQSNGMECIWPITQMDLGDATGLSSVHVNRSLQELKSMGLAEIQRRHLIIHDRDGLVDLAIFDSNYLHLRTG